MSIYFDLSARHQVAAANSHFYEQPTEPLYLDRVLQYHDLIYLVEGSWAITEGETEYPLEKDDVLLLTAGHHHYTRLPCLPKTRTMCIHISSEAGDRAEQPGALMLPTHLSARGCPGVKRYFGEIIQALWSDAPHKQERLDALFSLLALELEQACGRQGAKQGDLAAQLIQLVNATPHRMFRVSDVAGMYYVSTKTVENVMRKAVGMSFSKYQMNRKLEMAALQIEVEPDVRLSEIAATLGFCDEFHLSKAFKQKYGQSPSAYRKGCLSAEET